MATVTVTPGYNWVSGEVVTPAKMNLAAAPTVTAVVADGEITTNKLASSLDLGGKTVTLPNNSITANKLSTSSTAGTGVGFVREVAADYIVFQSASGAKVAQCWGTASATSGTVLTTVAFPVTFSAGPSVTATVSGISFGSSRIVSFGAVSTSGFNYQVRDDANNAQTNPVVWIAIGPVA